MIDYFYIHITYKGYNGIILIVLYNYKTIYVLIHSLYIFLAPKDLKKNLFS